MASKKGFARKERVGKQILQLVSGALLTEIQDPLVAHAQITDVDVSPDLRHAKVYWIPLGETEESVEEIGEALEKVSKFLRRYVGDQMETKYTPEIRFMYDESVERGRRIDDLLSNIEYSDQPEDEGDEH